MHEARFVTKEVSRFPNDDDLALNKRQVMKSWLSVLLIFSTYNLHVSAQNSVGDSTMVSLTIQLHTGRILPHSSSIAELTHERLWGVQSDISRMRLTQASWNTCNCYSHNGISISYFNFNNEQELGAAYSLAVFAEPELVHGRMNVGLRAGAGISYLTRVYDPVDNPRNLFFSNPWSGLLLMQISGRYHLDPQWVIRLAASYHHISNGGQKQPNKGMNFPALSLGVEHRSGYRPLLRRTKNISTDHAMHYYAGLSYNTRSVDESNFSSRSREMVIGIHAGFYRPIARMHGVGAGIELFHDNALKAQARQQSQSFDHRVASILVRHDFLFGRFDFSQALGFYLYKEYSTPDRVFQRYVLQYLLVKGLQIGFSLKAHLDTAEQMDIRIGVIF